MKQTTKNARFWALPKWAQRVAIAKDTLEQIKQKFYRPMKDTYLELDFSDNTNEMRGEQVPVKLDELFRKLKEERSKCEVCGIGACFVSLVNLGDEVITKKAFESEVVEDMDSVDDDFMRKKLRKVFTSNQLALIECAFEKDFTFDDKSKAGVPRKKREAASEFGEAYYDHTDRLVAIMKNIIKNDGTFKP